MGRRLKDIIIHLDYEDKCKDGKVEVNIIASEPEELIRCKDCKYSKHLKQYPKVNTWKCILTDVVYRADDFCSYGERREEE